MSVPPDPALELGQLADDDLPLELWQRLLIVQDKYSASGQPFVLANEAARAFYFVELTDFEVGNGGFVQYFVNTEGSLVDETQWALHVFGLDDQMTILSRGAECFVAERHLWEAFRTDASSDFEDLYDGSALTQFDDEWWSPDFVTRKAVFLREHLHEILDPSLGSPGT